MTRTLQDPLRIDCLAVAQGRLGLTLCPGRTGPGSTGFHRRNLAEDVAALRRWGARIVVSLIGTDEANAVPAAALGTAVTGAGLRWLHLPVTDTRAPEGDWLHRWRLVAPEIHRCLEQGGDVVVHCRAGLERTAAVAGLILCERGDTPAEALATIAAARPGARPTHEQRVWLDAVTGAGDPDLRLIRASLLGGAIGDALGAEIEFWPLSRIRARFPQGVDAILPHDGLPAAITDDTQMTLFTAEGLIRATIRQMDKGICHPPSVVHHALLRWMVTQGERLQVQPLDRTGLVADPRLHRRRAPGTTCIGALRASRRFGDPARNDSKGCGTIMRVAPIGLFLPGMVDDLADACSALTHGNRTGRDAARAMALVLADVMAGTALPAALARAQDLDLDPATLRAIHAARTAPRDGRPETVESLGGGWVAEEALSIALYAARVAESFEHGLRIAVTHSGDSDSTGAIAGNLLGLLFPDQVMEHPWRRQVECADLVCRLAQDLADARRQPDDLSDRLHAFYPGV